MLDVVVTIVIHQADPLFERVAEDPALKATFMKSLVKLLVSKLLHNISSIINAFILIIFIISRNHRLGPLRLFLNHWIQAKVSVKVNYDSLFAELATISFHITLCCYSVPATVFTTLLHNSGD